MDITISGYISIKFAPDLKDNMSTKELNDAHVLGYIEDAFKTSGCVDDSFQDNVKDCEDYDEIMSKYHINDYSEDDFEEWFDEFVSEDYINKYFDKEYIFKTTHFEEISDLDSLEIRFDVDLCMTLEQLCEEYLKYKECC